MGSAVMKFRRDRIQKKTQQVGKLSLVARAFMTGIKTSTETEVQGPASREGAQPFSATTSSKPTPTTVSVLSKLTQEKENSRESQTGTDTSNVKRSFQRFFRISDESLDSEQLQRKHRETEKHKLFIQEDRYGAVADNLNYDTMFEVDFDVTCVLCRMIKHDVLHECRICGCCYHHLCLESGGHCQDENFASALRDSEGTVGWSCSECEALGSLLSMEEMDPIIEKFDEYDKDQDTKITWADFLAVEKANDTIGNLQKKFSQYDADGDGVVSWNDFLTVKTLDLFEREPQAKLLTYLTQKEVERIKNCFRMKDDHNTGVITVAAAGQAYYEWLQGLGLESTEEGRNTQLIMHEPSNKRKLITWERFIRQKAVSILSARPNTITISPYLRACKDTAL